MTDYHVDRERWSRMSVFEQMGNIGSEVGRSINAHRAGDTPRFEAALARALDLFDATVDSMLRDREKSFRVREICARAISI